VPSRAPWPDGFARIPDEDWTAAPVESLAQKYDRVDAHGWYRNLDPTVEGLRSFLGDGSIALDYSGGTGILIERLLKRLPNGHVGIVDVDSSPKFLRLALEKLREDDRVAFRLIRYMKNRHRLQYVDEVLGEALVERGVDAIVSANAIHLYYDLADTLASWRRVVRPEGRVFVQSGNIHGDLETGQWIIDATVEALQEQAAALVREERRFARYRKALDDSEHMERHADFRRKIFPPVRALEDYLETFRGAGFEPIDVTVQGVEARVDEWRDFISVYHEGVLGWVGGAEKVTGCPPDPQVVEDRRFLIRLAFERLFPGPTFEAAWTYITCVPA
jgi:ubiquinone/menaquinone biosynthesis C-methylase UbiE